MKIAGLVLAGGRSRRFGTEKAVAALDGRPLVAHVLDTLRPRCVALAVNAPERSGAAAWANACTLPVLADPGGALDGPLTGVRQGLLWAAALGCDALATAPCDTPYLPTDLVARLAAALTAQPQAHAAFAVSPGGPHPLCALWPVQVLPALSQALDGGAHPAVQAMLAACGAVATPFPRDDAFANLNTPGDLADVLRPPLTPRS